MKRSALYTSREKYAGAMFFSCFSYTYLVIVSNQEVSSLARRLTPRKGKRDKAASNSIPPARTTQLEKYYYFAPLQPTNLRKRSSASLYLYDLQAETTGLSSL